MSISSLFVRVSLSALAVSGLAASALAGGPTLEYNNEAGPGQNEVNYVNLQFPSSISVTASTATPVIYGRVYQGGMTESGGPNGNIVAQVGFGPIGSNPLVDDSGWTWMNAGYNIQLGNDDEYQLSFTAPAVNGTYAYTYRFNLSTFWAGLNLGWTLADLNGAGSNNGLNFEANQLGVMTVTPTPGAAAVMGLGALAGFRRRR